MLDRHPGFGRSVGRLEPISAAPVFDLPPNGTRGPDTPAPMRALGRAFGPVGTLMFRLGVRIQGLPLLRLTTVGARTGERRRVILGWFPDGDHDHSWIVIASNAGARRHPGWAFNLARNPDQVSVDLGDGEVAVVPSLITGEERRALWEMVVARSPGYGKYELSTDRQIPLIRLTRRS